jgi:antagonist of KipI
MTFKVINPGMFSTIQDRGRIGFQSEGFSQAGAVDDISHVVANQLLGNDLNAATLEMTFQGVSLKALEDTVIAVVGSDIQMTIDNKEYTSAGRFLFLKERIFILVNV